MAKISLDTFITRAEELFSLGKYENALTTYGLLLKEYPAHFDAQIGVYLCDIGMESGEEAQALFDYYQIIKSEQEDAAEVMIEILSSLDSDKNKITKLLNIENDKLEYKDGIGYQEFLQFIEERGDFKRAFEDVMFSTKIILKNKEEYISLITDLMEKGQKELALQFLDSVGSAFENDQEIYALYDKLKEN